MTILQRSDSWFTARIGKMTASRIKDIDAKPKKGKAHNAITLEVINERLTGVATEKPTTALMQWGIDHEPQAIAEYEVLTGAFVKGTCLIDHPTIPFSGASPDGLIGEDGQIEAKCPSSTTHLNTLITREVPDEYIPQITWQLACTKRKWCDFISYDPRQPIGLHIIVIRVYAEDLDIVRYEQLVIGFNSIIDNEIQELRNRNSWVLDKKVA